MRTGKVMKMFVPILWDSQDQTTRVFWKGISPFRKTAESLALYEIESQRTAQRNALKRGVPVGGVSHAESLWGVQELAVAEVFRYR